MPGILFFIFASCESLIDMPKVVVLLSTVDSISYSVIYCVYGRRHCICHNLCYFPKYNLQPRIERFTSIFSYH